MVGHFVRARFGLVADGNAESCRGLEIDGVEADARADEEPAALESGEFVSAPVVADDGDHGVRGCERRVVLGTEPAQERVPVAGCLERGAGPGLHLSGSMRVDARLHDMLVRHDALRGSSAGVVAPICACDDRPQRTGAGCPPTVISPRSRVGQAASPLAASPGRPELMGSSS